MKKFLAFIFAALIVCAAFFGCGKGKKGIDKKYPKDESSATVTTLETPTEATKPVKHTGIVSIDKEPESSDKEPENSKIAEIADIYRKRLKLIGSGPDYFALIDFNGDGIVECITKKNADGYNNCMIYNYDDGKLFSNHINTWSEVNRNGNYIIKGGFNCSAEYKITLSENALKTVCLWDLDFEGSDNERCYVNDIPVSRQEFDSYVKSACREKVEWYKFNEENMDKYLTAENLSNASLLCQCGYSRIIELYKSFYEFSQKNENAFSLSFDELYEIFGISEDENERDCFHSIYAAVVNASHKGGAYYAGYAEKDLNGDGYPELILLTSNYKILDIYTKLNGKITLVDFAGTMGSIDANGNIYISAVGKGNNWLYRVSRLSSEGMLETYLEYGCHDTNINDMEWEYYIIKNGERSVARKDEIYALEEQYYSFFCNESAVNPELGFVPFFEKFDPSGMK